MTAARGKMTRGRKKEGPGVMCVRLDERSDQRGDGHARAMHV
jgi:hypothetical protein